MAFEHLNATVIAAGLCSTCGLCAGICPVQAILIREDGMPQLIGKCIDCEFCHRACPGHDVDLPALSQEVFAQPYSVDCLQGYVERQYVGFSNNKDIRQKGASGGMVTALLCFLLKKGIIDGAVVATMDEEKPWQTVGAVATTESQIQESAQSKYCVTPSLSSLSELRKLKGKFAVVGLPCQVLGLRKLASVDPVLYGKIYCIFGLYCNCNIQKNGHVELLETSGIELDDIEKFNFRTGNWPGGMGGKLRNGSAFSLHKISLTSVLNVMFRIYGPKRCYFCVDALSEYADISFGDFWAFDYTGELAKLEHANLISQRSDVGRKILEMANENRHIELQVLPEELSSKRILNMAAGKKMRAFARLAKSGNQKITDVDYHISLPRVTAKARKSLMLYSIWQYFRTPVLRKLLLRILISPAALFLERINMTRKRRFCSFHHK